MTHFRHRLVWLLVVLLATVTLGADYQTFAEDAAVADAKVVAVQKTDATASTDKAECHADQADCEQSCEKDKTRQKLATPSSGFNILELIFSRNKTKLTANQAPAAAVNDQPADDNSAEGQAADGAPALAATHRQVALLKVTRDGEAAAGQPARRVARGGWGVKSFCLDNDDNLLVAVGDAKTGQLL
ncbi:MAG: hypothetical protein ACR2NM_15605, partial [Bythopirellula sp.]